MSKTLIVVDVQVDFCPGGRLAVAGGDEIVAPINAMMDDYDHVILTQDWHPQNHSSFAVNHPGGEQKVAITPEATILMAAPAETSELKPGAQVAMTASRQADGSYSTSRVTVAKAGAKLPL